MGCPNLTEFPIGVAQNPNASGLHFASNSNITAEKMLEGLQLLNSESPKLNGGKGSKLSILQMPGQKCKYLPDMTNLKNLGMLDIRGCDMEYIEKAFGKDHYFSTIWAQNNKFKTLPVDEDGYFVALHGDFEELNMSYNEFEKLPNIFKGNSVYILKTIDFSFNKINGFDESREPWKGINVEIFNLAYNQFDYFPKFYTDGDDCSQISYLIMQGNKISSFEEEAFEGKYNYWTTALTCLSTTLPNFRGRSTALTCLF